MESDRCGRRGGCLGPGLILLGAFNVVQHVFKVLCLSLLSYVVVLERLASQLSTYVGSCPYDSASYQGVAGLHGSDPRCGSIQAARLRRDAAVARRTEMVRGVRLGRLGLAATTGASGRAE